MLSSKTFDSKVMMGGVGRVTENPKGQQWHQVRNLVLARQHSRAREMPTVHFAERTTGKSDSEARKTSRPAVNVLSCASRFSTRNAAAADHPRGSSIASQPRGEKLGKELDQYVIGQDKSKKLLSVAVHSHYKRLMHNLEVGTEDVEIENPTSF